MKRFRLAPLCGVTDHVYRAICADMGCEQTYTEMISAMGYLCAPNQRATRELMIRDPAEPCLVLQLFGKDPAVVAEAAGRIEETGRYDGIDLNMGCPAHKVASSGEGAGLMLRPDTAWRMMRDTVRAVRLPVSVKMRLGWDEGHIDVMEYALMAQEAGVAEIAIHGRTRTQQYAGEANWDWIRAVKARVRIPVIGNGDLFTAEDAADKIRNGEADGVMIGRGAMGNPWIFRELKQLSAGEKKTEVSLAERKQMIFRHYRAMLESRPEPVAVREMRKHIAWYLHGLRGAAQTRNTMDRLTSPDQVFAELDRFFDDPGRAERRTP